jgi:hypothetical protein
MAKKKGKPPSELTPKQYINEFFERIIKYEGKEGSRQAVEKIQGIRNKINKRDLRTKENQRSTLSDLESIVALEDCNICDGANVIPADLQEMWKLDDYGQNENWQNDMKKITVTKSTKL